MAAAGTEAVELKAVSLDSEAVLGGDFLLQAFNLAVFELHDLAASSANEVVVVPLVRDVVILGLGPKVAGLGQTCITKQIEGAVDCGQAQMGIVLCQLVVHSFRRDMFLAKKGTKNQLPLASEFQLMFGQMVFQGFHLFRISARCHDQPPGVVIKTQSYPLVKR